MILQCLSISKSFQSIFGLLVYLFIYFCLLLEFFFSNCTLLLSCVDEDNCLNSYFSLPIFISDDTIFHNPMVQEAIRMGFSFRDIKKIMEEKIHTSGSNYRSLEILVADLVNAQKDNTQDESSQTSLQQGMLGCF